MNKTVLGIYDTELKAKNVVEGLIVQGYRAEEIIVVALGNQITEDFPANSRVERIVAEQDESVVEKIKQSLLPDEVQSPRGVGNKLLKLGLSDREAPMYATDVENGRILVLVNQEKTKEAKTITPCSTNRNRTIPAQQID